MYWAINPLISNIDEILQLTNEYSLRWEINDVTSPCLYEDKNALNQRIDFYSAFGRDYSKDTLHGAFLGIDITALDSVIQKRSRELVYQSIDIANKLGIGAIVFHTGLIGGLELDYYLDNWINSSVQFWTDICINNPNLNIYLENSFEQSPDIFVRFMNEMKAIPNIGLCLDYGHAILTQTPIEEWVSQLSKYIRHIHLNDNDLKNDLHLAPGMGKIDFNQWYELMNIYNVTPDNCLLELGSIDAIKQGIKFVTDNHFIH